MYTGIFRSNFMAYVLNLQIKTKNVKKKQELIEKSRGIVKYLLSSKHTRDKSTFKVLLTSTKLTLPPFTYNSSCTSRSKCSGVIYSLPSLVNTTSKSCFSSNRVTISIQLRSESLKLYGKKVYSHCISDEVVIILQLTFVKSMLIEPFENRLPDALLHPNP